MSILQVIRLRARAAKLRADADMLAEKAADIEFNDTLRALGWKIGDDLERDSPMWVFGKFKPVHERVRLEGRKGHTGSFLARPYNCDGKLVATVIRIWPSDGWKKVKK
jgi:hypothetical protein